MNMEKSVTRPKREEAPGIVAEGWATAHDANLGKGLREGEAHRAAQRIEEDRERRRVLEAEERRIADQD